MLNLFIEISIFHEEKGSFVLRYLNMFLYVIINILSNNRQL